MNMQTWLTAAAGAALMITQPILAQSLLRRPAAAAPAPVFNPAVPGGAGGPVTGAPAPVVAPAAEMTDLASVSLFAVNPPKPKSYAKNDKIEIIINETALQSHQQKLDTKKGYELTAELAQFPSFAELIKQLTLRDGIGNNGPNIGISGDSEFKSDGKYERKDRMTARLSALVTEVKPNGLLLIEAREVMQSDDEIKTMVVSGLVEPRDITQQGTVQSTQMANLIIKTIHEGQTKETATKGFIPRVFEAIFSF